MVAQSFFGIVPFNSSLFVSFSDSEIVIVLETATLGNLVAAIVATPPMGRSRRVNFAIHLFPVSNRTIQLPACVLRMRRKRSRSCHTFNVSTTIEGLSDSHASMNDLVRVIESEDSPLGDD